MIASGLNNKLASEAKDQKARPAVEEIGWWQWHEWSLVKNGMALLQNY